MVPPNHSVDDRLRPAEGPAGRIFLECTYTYFYGGNTGIQRVVRSLCNRCREVGAQIGVECTPIVHDDKQFYPVTEVRLERAANRRMRKTPGPVDFYFRNIYHHLRKLLYAVLPFPQVARFLFAPRDSFGLNAILLAPYRFLATSFHGGRRRKDETLPEPLRFRRGDVIVLLDSSWLVDLWGALSVAREEGAKVVGVVYDLIPLTHSRFCVEELVRGFEAWLGRICPRADAFIAISNTISRGFREYLLGHPELCNASDKKFDFFYLGTELDNYDPAGKVRRKVRKAFEITNPSRMYLTVGTIEPRKNHAYLLDAFDKVWEKCGDVGLCLVGGKGWSIEDLWMRICTHPLFRKRLFMFNDLTDTELAYCYRRSKALVYPSMMEGFGLPLVEALHQRLPVFASDIPIFREVGGEYCVFFDLASCGSLARLIVDFEKTGHLPPVRSAGEFNWPGWDESTRSLLEKTQALFRE